jgi:chemotaxis protein CheY-P-specific phosphatase CheC
MVVVVVVFGEGCSGEVETMGKECEAAEVLSDLFVGDGQAGWGRRLPE